MAPEGLREQNQLLQEMLEQQKAYIEMQEKRIAEKDAAIADLRRLVDGLQPLKANLLKPLAAQLGLTPPRETMANWCIYCAEHYLLPLYEKLHSLLLKRDVLHADETTCQVLHEKGRAADSASYMWIFLAGSDGLAPIGLYDYQPSRRGACARDFLEGFHGLLQCDGNQGYNKVEDVALVCCLAHCRREFYEAVPAQRRKNIKLLDILSEETIPEPILP